jgi:hypothetical protein
MDREVYHGEEDKGEEAIHQKAEGSCVPQEAQNDKGVGETLDQEEIGPQKGRSEASFGAKARSSFDAGRRTGAHAVVESAKRLWRRWRQRRLIAIEQERNAAAPSAAACIARACSAQ